MSSGIYWDPREPPPPGCRGAGDLDTEEYIERYKPRSRVDLNSAEDGNNCLRPWSTTLRAHIAQDTAKITITQWFLNARNFKIKEGAFVFPLPTGCSVTGFTCRIGQNRAIEAKVEKKSVARKLFRKAVDKELAASLLEENTPEIFTTTLANIPANTGVKAEITLIALLKHHLCDDIENLTLTIPTCIAPRYGSPPTDLENIEKHWQVIANDRKAAGDSKSEKVKSAHVFGGISVQIEVLAGKGDKHVSSNTHEVSVTKKLEKSSCETWDDFVHVDGAGLNETFVVSLVDNFAPLVRDFVLNISTSLTDGHATPYALLETHPSLENHKALMVSIPPKFALQHSFNCADREIVFVADCSGSMEDKIIPLKMAMTFFLKGIPTDRHFNIWRFGDHYDSLWTKSQAYGEQTLATALNYVSKRFCADMGGTELLPALEALVGERSSHRLRDIIVLTDGEVWKLDETIEFVQRTRKSGEGRTRFFCLGIGNAVSHALVDGIAKAGCGYSEIIPAASQGGWEDRLVSMLSAASTGHVHSLRLQIQYPNYPKQDGESVLPEMSPNGGPTIQQSPVDLSSMSPFLNNRIFFLFDSAARQPPKDHVTIKTTSADGKEVVHNIPIVSLHKKDSIIHKLGARAILNDLERKQSYYHTVSTSMPGSAETSNIEHQVRSHAEKLGCKWSLASKWTSFYALEKSSEEAEQQDYDFLSQKNARTNLPNNDMDLLRPRPRFRRDMPGRGAWPHSMNYLQNHLDDSIEETSDSNSDSEDPYSYTNPHAYRFDWDDGHGDGEGGGSYSGGAGSSGNSQQPPNSNGGSNSSRSNGDESHGPPRYNNGNRHNEMRQSNLSNSFPQYGFYKCVVLKRKSEVDRYRWTRTVARRTRRRSISRTRQMLQNARRRRALSFIPPNFDDSSLSFRPPNFNRDPSLSLSPIPLPSPPPATWGEQDQRVDPIPLPIDKAKSEELIRQLIEFQTYEGTFKFDSPFTLRRLMGLQFTTATQRLTHRCKRYGKPVRESFRCALAVAISVHLAHEHWETKDLWQLMDCKARSFLTQQLPLTERHELLSLARTHLTGDSRPLVRRPGISYSFSGEFVGVGSLDALSRYSSVENLDFNLGDSNLDFASRMFGLRREDQH